MRLGPLFVRIAPSMWVGTGLHVVDGRLVSSHGDLWLRYLHGALRNAAAEEQ